MGLMESIVQRTVDYERGGIAPGWVKTFVRFVVAAMWASHEIHALLWGRGDGLDNAKDTNLVDWNATDPEHQRQGIIQTSRMPWTG
jgi:hypothetical protein